MTNLDARLQSKLEEMEAEEGRRFLRTIEFEKRTGLRYNFASNDYLGWRNHPALIEAATGATVTYGTGSGASRLLGGTTKLVTHLEEELADWKGTKAALVFSSGFAAGLGTIPALVGSGDVVIVDKLAHACLIDAARLSGAVLRAYPHNNLAKLERILASVRAKDAKCGILIITESLFSMDGDGAPLQELVELKDKFGAWLMVDEAHATGVYGTKGAGQVAGNLAPRVDILMGTFSKALGSIGGFIAGSRLLIDFLINKARSFVYSTALPPGAIAATLAAVRMAQTEQGAVARQRLRAYVGLFKQSCADAISQSAIQPIICGSNGAALERARVLEGLGYFTPAVRFPSVPRNQARLRITLSAKHTPELILGLSSALKKTKVMTSSGGA